MLTQRTALIPKQRPCCGFSWYARLQVGYEVALAVSDAQLSADMFPMAVNGSQGDTAKLSDLLCLQPIADHVADLHPIHP